MVKTYKIKSTKDFSTSFLFLRVIGNTIWLAYSIELNTFQFFISNVISVGASAFISYYKILDLYHDYKRDDDNTYTFLPIKHVAIPIDYINNYDI